ncbi:Ubiquitin carboxyl-terminal hydrolase 9 [Diplonema papillatum]|nr:Ubiquitin carboxyl-terminal hydrolase 9 [Diplonema papillatum]
MRRPVVVLFERPKCTGCILRSDEEGTFEECQKFVEWGDSYDASRWTGQIRVAKGGMVMRKTLSFKPTMVMYSGTHSPVIRVIVAGDSTWYVLARWRIHDLLAAEQDRGAVAVISGNRDHYVQRSDDTFGDWAEHLSLAFPSGYPADQEAVEAHVLLPNLVVRGRWTGLRDRQLFPCGETVAGWPFLRRDSHAVVQVHEPVVAVLRRPAVFGPGRVGLINNTGVQCFVNSVMQCLAHTPLFAEFFAQDYQKGINRDNPLGSGGNLATHTGALIGELWKAHYAPASSQSFFRALGKYNSAFAELQQQDAQEFLATLLDGLHEDYNLVTERIPVPKFEPPALETTSVEEVAEEFWKRHLLRNRSFVVQHCMGLLKSSLQCRRCGKGNLTFDPFMTLSLELPDSEPNQLISWLYFPAGYPSVAPILYQRHLPPFSTLRLLKEMTLARQGFEPRAKCELAGIDYTAILERFTWALVTYDTTIGSAVIDPSSIKDDGVNIYNLLADIRLTSTLDGRRIRWLALFESPAYNVPCTEPRMPVIINNHVDLNARATLHPFLFIAPVSHASSDFVTREVYRRCGMSYDATDPVHYADTDEDSSQQPRKDLPFRILGGYWNETKVLSCFCNARCKGCAVYPYPAVLRPRPRRRTPDELSLSPTLPSSAGEHREAAGVLAMMLDHGAEWITAPDCTFFEMLAEPEDTAPERILECLTEQYHDCCPHDWTEHTPKSLAFELVRERRRAEEATMQPYPAFDGKSQSFDAADDAEVAVTEEMLLAHGFDPPSKPADPSATAGAGTATPPLASSNNENIPACSGPGPAEGSSEAPLPELRAEDSGSAPATGDVRHVDPTEAAVGGRKEWESDASDFVFSENAVSETLSNNSCAANEAAASKYSLPDSSNSVVMPTHRDIVREVHHARFAYEGRTSPIVVKVEWQPDRVPCALQFVLKSAPDAVRRPLDIVNTTEDETDFDEEANIVVHDRENCSHLEQKAAQDKKVYTLESCLELFTRVEKLEDSNFWKCPRCNEEVPSKKKFEIWSLPNVLFVHVKRFACRATCSLRLRHALQFPLEGFDLSKYLAQRGQTALSGCELASPTLSATQNSPPAPPGEPFEFLPNASQQSSQPEPDNSSTFPARPPASPRYRLRGAVCHLGPDIQVGHYTSSCYHSKLGKWFCFNDETVTEQSTHQVLNDLQKDVYLLCYVRDDINDSDWTKPYPWPDLSEVQKRVEEENSKAEERERMEKKEREAQARRNVVRCSEEREAKRQRPSLSQEAQDFRSLPPSPPRSL